MTKHATKLKSEIQSQAAGPPGVSLGRRQGEVVVTVKDKDVDKDKLVIKAVEILRKSRNEMHKNHRLNASGTGAHRNKKRYRRRLKHQQPAGEE